MAETCALCSIDAQNRAVQSLRVTPGVGLQLQPPPHRALVGKKKKKMVVQTELLKVSAKVQIYTQYTVKHQAHSHPSIHPTHPPPPPSRAGGVMGEGVGSNAISSDVHPAGR